MFLLVFFDGKSFIFDEVQLICIFSSLIACVFVLISKNPLPNQRSHKIPYVFFYSFIVLALTFRSLISFEFSSFFKDFFFNVYHFKVFIEFIIYNTVSVFCFGFLASRYVGF